MPIDMTEIEKLRDRLRNDGASWAQSTFNEAADAIDSLLAEIKRGREENRKLQAEVKDLRHLFDLARETGR